MHFRIEVEGVEAHASTRYLSVHAGGNGGGGVNAVEKAVKIIVALQELEQQWANAKSHPILPLGFDTLAPAIIVGGPGGGTRRPAQPVLERRHGAELLLGRIQHVVLPGRVVRGRAGRGRGRRGGGLRDRSVAARAPAAVHLEARQHLLPAARRAARPPGGEHARRVPRDGVGLDRDARRASGPRPISPGTASASCRGSSAGPGRSRSATSPTSSSTRSSCGSRRRSTRRCWSSGAGSAGSVRCVPSSTRWSARSTSSTSRRRRRARARCWSGSSAPGSAAATSRASRRAARAERRR